VLLLCGTMLIADAKGHGSRQMYRVDKYGFPRTGAKTSSIVNGFKTGDMVVASVPSGKKQGMYSGRVAVRRSGFYYSNNGCCAGYIPQALSDYSAQRWL
ncbi:hypothetical protein V6O07_16510, partial [Arthrospira platensis SPKY2]